MKLSALTLIVPDYDEAIAFYCKVMGFELIEDIPQGNIRWVKIAPSGGGAGFVLAQPANQKQKDAIGQQGAGRVWLFLETEDFSSDYNRFKEAGVTFEEKPRVEPYGTVAVFQDVFGNRWDLIEYG